MIAYRPAVLKYLYFELFFLTLIFNKIRDIQRSEGIRGVDAPSAADTPLCAVQITCITFTAVYACSII